MNIVPWRSYGDSVPAPDQPMYVPIPGTVAGGTFNDQHAKHMASIMETKDQLAANVDKVRQENARIHIEQDVKELVGITDIDDSEYEPWKGHMEKGSARRKCKKCRKPYWEWRLHQDTCEMCQLRAGWDIGMDSKKDKAEKRERAARELGAGDDYDDSSGDETSAQTAASSWKQPEAKPKAKPEARPMAEPLQTPAARGAKGNSKGRGYASTRPQRQIPWHQTSYGSRGRY